MRQVQDVLSVGTAGQGLYEVTSEVSAFVAKAGMETGLLILFCRHTSASLTIQENADPDVARDFCEWFARIVPEEASWMRHTAEGPDDMPAHIKSALTGVSLSIPVSGGRMALGTWQGIHLIEHRKTPHRRQIVLHLVGE